MQFPVRKSNRLKNFDYSSPGAYFITICTKNRECIFWDDVGAAIGRPTSYERTPVHPVGAAIGRPPSPEHTSVASVGAAISRPPSPEHTSVASVGAAISRPHLSEEGMIVEQAILEIPKRYKTINVDNYVVMPNHLHLLLSVNTDESGRPVAAPTISQAVSQLKAAVTRRIGHPVWQKLFHDHVVRGNQDYQEIWQYIDNNPARWKEDKLYSPYRLQSLP